MSRKKTLPPSVHRDAVSSAATSKTTVMQVRSGNALAPSKAGQLGGWKLSTVGDDLPEVQVAVVQQGQEMALARQKVHLGDSDCILVQACELHAGGTIDLDGLRPGAK